MFEGLKARLDRLLRARPDQLVEGVRLREALLEARVAVVALRDALAATERELAAERTRLADAERRGALATDIADGETAAVAAEFAGRHRARVELLERKAAVQRDELAAARREADELLRRVRAGTPTGASVEAAWQSLEEAGEVRPGAEPERDAAVEAERRLHEQAIEAQLAYLKQKLGKR
jgi:hypothetical protein